MNTYFTSIATTLLAKRHDLVPETAPERVSPDIRTFNFTLRYVTCRVYPKLKLLNRISSFPDPTTLSKIYKATLPFATAQVLIVDTSLGVMNGPLLNFNCSQNLNECSLARAPQIFALLASSQSNFFYFCSCSQKNLSARHARECSQRPFVTPLILTIQL